MYGYVLAAVIGLICVVFLFVGLSSDKSREGETPKKGARESVNKTGAPSADEPTPDRSTTASPSQIARAETKTPPA